MKKFFKIFFIVLLIIFIIISIAGYFFIKNFDINKYKPLILSEAKKELGRDIDFSSANLDVSLSHGLAIKLENLKIDDSPAYQSDKLLQVDELSLGIDILSYLLQKKIYISTIYVNSAQISIVKQPDGSLNINELTQKESSEPVKEKTVKQPATSTKEPETKKQSLPQILINSFTFKNCSVKYIDKSTKPATKIELSQIDFEAPGFSPSHPSSFEIKAALFSDTQNINCSGTLILNLSTQKVTLKPFEIKTDLSKLSIDKIKADLPQIKDKPMPTTLKGLLYLNVKKTAFTPSGLLDFTADLNFSNGKIVIDNNSANTFLDIDKIDFNLSNFSLTEECSYSFNMAFLNDSQNISSTGFIKPDLINKKADLRNIKVSTDLSSVSMDRLKQSFPDLADTTLPSTLKGQFQTNIKKAVLSPDGLIDLLVDLNFSNGNIVINDSSKNRFVNIDKIDFNLSDFSLNDECSYSFDMAFLNDSQNISSTGILKTNIKNNEFNLHDIKFSTELSSFSIDKLKSSFPDLNDSDLPEELNGSIQVFISTLKLNKDGLVTLLAKGGLTNGKIVMNDKLKSPVENIDAKWTMSETTFNFSNLYMKIGQGEITGSAIIDNYLTQRQFNMMLNLNALDLAELLNQKKESVKLEGILNGSLNLAGQGTDKEQIINSLSGTGDLSLSDGKLTDINILNIVLDKLTVFPNLAEILEAGLPEKYKEKLAQKDTVLTKANVNASFANKQISLTPVTVYADNFTFKGKGDASFDKSYILKGAFYVPQNLSLRMVKRVNELEYLLDEQNQLFIPLQVHGSGTDMTFIVDLKYLSKKVIRTKGREELKKVIYKSLKKDTDEQQDNNASTSQTETETDTGQDNQTSSGTENKSIEEVIIDEVLDRFLKLEEY